MSAQHRQAEPGTACKARGARKEIRQLLKNIELAGGEVRQGGTTGHFKVYRDGLYIGGLVSTPSSSRSMANDIARLRRNGLPVDSKGSPL